MSRIDVINCLSGVFGSLGALLISLAIFYQTKSLDQQNRQLQISQAEQNRQLQISQEEQNRQLQISQITIQLYNAECQQKKAYFKLISTQFAKDRLFPEDRLSHLKLIKNYLKLSGEKEGDCIKDLQKDLQNEYDRQIEIKNLQIKNLGNYEIRIYYVKENQELTTIANFIKKDLKDYGILGKIKMEPRSINWFRGQRLLSNKVIFYQKGVEDRAGKALQDILFQISPKETFILQDTGNASSPNSVSIMLK